MTTSTLARISAPAFGVLHELRVFIVFLAVVYLVHFAAAPYFFLYEDDYYHVGIPAVQSLSWVWEQIRIVCLTWPQGRPGMFITPAAIGGLINSTESVLVGYLPAFLIISANGYLAYRLFRMRLPAAAAILGASFGLLSCADPHKALLTHTTLQFAITLNLIGLLLYLNQRAFLAFVIAGSSLFFYETSFAIFATAELFFCLNARIKPRRLAGFIGAWVVVAACVFALRVFLGEMRATEAAGNFTELSQRIVTNVTLGPLLGLSNSFLHPLERIFAQPQWWQLSLSMLTVLGLCLFVLTFARILGTQQPGDASINWIAAISVMALLLLLPYALQLKRTVFPGYLRPVSGYHLVLGLGLSYTAALASAKCISHKSRIALVGLVIFALGSASMYQNLLIQHDYARSARYQAHFWAEIQRTASDAEPGDVILVPSQHLLESEYVLSNSWGVTHAWFVLFEQTGPLKDWANVPSVRPVTVFLVDPGWEENVLRQENHCVLQYPGYTPPGFDTGKIPLVDGQVIVLETNFSEPFRRRTGAILTSAGRIELKSPPAQGPRTLPYTRLAKYLFRNFIN